MPKIVDRAFYNGSKLKISRLGLQPLINEVEAILQSFPLLLLEKLHENSAAAITDEIDSRFRQRDWIGGKSGGIDWKKCVTVNGTQACIGVEVQISGRSELIYRDIAHFKITLVQEGEIDVGVEVVPSDHMSRFITDRTLSFSYAKHIIEETLANLIPIVLIAIEHDGVCDQSLVKKVTNISKRKQPPPA